VHVHREQILAVKDEKNAHSTRELHVTNEENCGRDLNEHWY